MEKLKEKLIRFLISILTLPFRLIRRGLAALICSILHRSKPEIAIEESSRSIHRNGQVVENETGAAIKNYLQLVTETNQILQDNQPGQLQAGISLEQTAAELADFDAKLKKLNRSEAQKAAWAKRREKQAQVDLERQRAEQKRLAQIQKAQEKARRSCSAQKGLQTRRNRQENKQ